MNKAHQLFIEKGFQATSIQDILEFSGISKGTFYNYFPSKNELLIALIKTIYTKLEKERNELLIGQDPANIGIFIQQIEFQMRSNKENNLITLFEEVIFSKDEELKQFIKRGQLRMLSWIYRRFTDIFGPGKKPYLLDCAVMFTGILHHNLKYYVMAYESNPNLHQVVRYSVERVAKMVNEVAETDDQLLRPELIESWMPDQENTDQAFRQKLFDTVFSLKEQLTDNKEQTKYVELLEFIQDELLESKSSRKFLIESAMFTLNSSNTFSRNEEFQKLQQIITDFFS
jgi:AcrR family transcriptional regulator